MNKIAYIQQQNNDWLNDNCYILSQAFKRMGYTVKTFEKFPSKYVDMHRIINQPQLGSIVFGGLNTMKEIMESNGIIIPSIYNIHEHLPDYYTRKIAESTVAQIKLFDLDQYPFFVKPLNSYKTFTGFVAKTPFDIQVKLQNIDDNEKLLLSSIVDFDSEFRCFILDKKLIGCKNYTGSFKMLPDFDFINDAIQHFYDQPIAYTLDFGIITPNIIEQTELIEINDGYGFGSYGFNPILYAKMVEARWIEITKGTLWDI